MHPRGTVFENSKYLHLGILKSADRMSAFPSGNSNHKHFLDPDSDPDTDLSACPHRQVNPNNSNFHESGILKS